MSANWVLEFEEGTSLLSLANRLNLPEGEVVLGVANTLWDWGEGDRAIPLLERYLSKDGDIIDLQMAYLRCLMSEGAEDKLKIRQAVSGLHTSFRKKRGNRPPIGHTQHDRRGDRPLKLGFVCTYSNLAPVRYSLVPMLKALDHSRFHVSFFSLNQEGMPELDEVCDEHIVLLNADVHEICRGIQERKIDILFDLNGILREDFPYEIFALQPAPVQAGWWNTPFSCGMETVKYFFMDRTMLLPEHDDMFTENIIQIPGNATICYQLSDQYPVHPLPFLSEGIFTFASFTALFKINDVVLDTWAKILSGSANSRLLIKCRGASMPRFQKRVDSIFEAHKIDPQRIFLMEEETFDAMMLRFAGVDLCLNTYSYGAGTTTLNAIWQGVPTMSMTGSFPHARGAASMMVDCGLADFVAPDREGYIQGAIEHSKNPKRLEEVRPGLRDHVKVNSTWLNPERFARNFEAACQSAWGDWIGVGV